MPTSRLQYLTAAVVLVGLPQWNLLTNGSMEFWSRARLGAAASGIESRPPAAEDLLTPKRWSCNFAQPTSLRRSNDAHGGQYALAITLPRGVHDGSLSLGYLELNPGSSYAFGVWAKGSGKLTVRLFGKAYEGVQELGKASGDAQGAWRQIGAPFLLPTHVRMVRIQIDVPVPCELVLDDAYISATLDKPYDADAVLSRKYAADADTLVMEDFESNSDALTLVGRARMTDGRGGRFGRGLRADKPDFATLLMPVAQMPREGTLECWVSPDSVPREGADYYLTVCTGGEILARLNGWNGGMFWAWPKPDGRTSNYLEAPADFTSRRVGPGEWRHVALTWDASLVRYYVDGMLVEASPARADLWSKTPTHLIVGGLYPQAMWNGVIDEIRLSKVRRYGAVEPKGDQLVAWEPSGGPGVQTAGGAAVPERSRPKIDAAEERKKLIGSLPPTRPGEFETRPTPGGDLVYEATSAKPLVDSLPLVLEKDTYVKGLTAAKVRGARSGAEVMENVGLYWRLGAIAAGKYWVGVTYESQNHLGAEGPAPSLGVYLNGRIIPCTTLSDPVQIAPGKWFAQIQAAATETLKEGDEIAVASLWQEARVVRLTLHTKEPHRGAHRVAVNFGGDWGNLYTTQGINVCGLFLNVRGEPLGDNGIAAPEQRAGSVKDILLDNEGKAAACCYLANPLPVSLTCDYQCDVKGYYREIVGRDAQRITLPAHSRVRREVKFAVTPDEPAYSIDARIKAVEVPNLGWPEADTVSFFPGLRQSVPWPESFQYRDLRRLVFDEVGIGKTSEVSKTSEVYDRRFVMLRDQWEAALTADLEPPVPTKANLTFVPKSLPVSFDLGSVTPRPHGAYLRRTLELPADVGQRACRLCVCDPIDEATAYMNGRRVGGVKGGDSMFFADITQAVRPGKNELMIVVRDLMAIMDPAYVNRKAPTPSPNYLDAPGLYGSDRLGLGKVWLEITPKIAAQDVAVRPSVRQKKLGLQTRIINHTGQAARVLVKAKVLDQRDTVLEIGHQEVLAESGKLAEVTLERAWSNPRLWSPQDPHLYLAIVEVLDSATGRRFDLSRARFGFCESWIDGPRIYFNGLPIRLKGSGTPAPVGTCLRNDFNLARSAHVSDPIGLDYLDEFGCLTSMDITGIWNSPSKHNVDRDAFWQNARQNMLTAARHFQNHPSIVAWDLSNEWLWYYEHGTAAARAAAQRFKALADALAAQDGGRWSFFDGDSDLEGLHDNYSFHYMLPYYYGDLEGHSIYWPDGAYWGKLEKGFDPADNLPVTPLRPKLALRPDKKVVMDSENLWKVDRLMPPGLSPYVGEEDVLSPAVDSGSGPIAWFWKTNLDGHRDAMLSMNCYYGHITAVNRRGYLLQTFIMPDMVHHGFSGRTLTRRYTLLNDVFAPARLKFRCRLLGPDGRAVDQGSVFRDMASGDLWRGSLSFRLPEVDRRTTMVLELRLEADGKFVCGEERDIEVWPDRPVATGKPSRRVFLYDPKGPTALTLKAIGVPFEPVSALSPPPGDGQNAAMIIGEGALDAATAPLVSHLGRFVEDGGRVLILAQTVSPLGLPATTKLEAREWASQCFVAAANHPILRGLSDWDLHFWAPRRDVARGAYTKPDGGPATSLVHSGSTTGMEWVQMMELYRGQGLYLLCQLPLVDKHMEEPMAREVLARTMNYLGGPRPWRRPTARLQAVAARGGAVEKRLAEAGVAYEVASPRAQLDASSVALVDASAETDEAARQGWAAALAAGATLVVCNAQPQDASWLTRLAGRPVAFTVPPYRMWEGRGFRTRFDALTAGLSQVDLHWRRQDGAESASRQAEDASLTIEPLQDFSVQAEGAEELVFPGALIRLQVGKGALIIDQRRWTTTHEKLAKPANRQVSALALGLGVQVAPAVESRGLPADVDFRSIDLAPFATRDLADSVADDGKGGWSDQGPNADLRTLAKGRHVFQGVPFVLADTRKDGKCCIVLSSDARPMPGNLPSEVTIPLGHCLEGLYFLHAFAYTGEGSYAGLYQVQYADGTTADIALYGELNVRDWVSPPGPFVREKGTTSSVAWTGSCPTFRQIAVYKMLWVNPRPEETIRAVRFANPSRKGVPALLALTAAVAKDAKPPQTPAAAEKARDLLSQALQAVQDRDDAKALPLLRASISADSTLTTAHQALCDLHERAGDGSASLAAYQAWVRAGAHTPLPYNRIGQILEGRKDYKAALEAYTRSLQIEWNQPPIVEAKARLEKVLNQR